MAKSIPVSPEVAQVTVKRVFNSDSESYDDQYTWEGPENGVVAVASPLRIYFTDHVPWAMKVLDVNVLANITYLVREEVTI